MFASRLPALQTFELELPLRAIDAQAHARPNISVAFFDGIARVETVGFDFVHEPPSKCASEINAGAPAKSIFRMVSYVDHLADFFLFYWTVRN